MIRKRDNWVTEVQNSPFSKPPSPHSTGWRTDFQVWGGQSFLQGPWHEVQAPADLHSQASDHETRKKEPTDQRDHPLRAYTPLGYWTQYQDNIGRMSPRWYTTNQRVWESIYANPLGARREEPRFSIIIVQFSPTLICGVLVLWR